MSLPYINGYKFIKESPKKGIFSYAVFIKESPKKGIYSCTVFIKWYSNQQERSLFLRIEKDGYGGILQVIWGKDLEKSWIIPKENLSYLSAMKYSNLSD